VEGSLYDIFRHIIQNVSKGTEENHKKLSQVSLYAGRNMEQGPFVSSQELNHVPLGASQWR
jgi:hypothetical protein